MCHTVLPAQLCPCVTQSYLRSSVHFCFSLISLAPHCVRRCVYLIPCSEVLAQNEEKPRVCYFLVLQIFCLKDLPVFVILIWHNSRIGFLHHPFFNKHIHRVMRHLTDSTTGFIILPYSGSKASIRHLVFKTKTRYWECQM
jgi:hypothetical protein